MSQSSTTSVLLQGRSAPLQLSARLKPRGRSSRLERGSFLIEGYKQVVEVCGKLAAKRLLVADYQEFKLSIIQADAVCGVPPPVIAKIKGMAKSDGIVAMLAIKSRKANECRIIVNQYPLDFSFTVRPHRAPR